MITAEEAKAIALEGDDIVEKQFEEVCNYIRNRAMEGFFQTTWRFNTTLTSYQKNKIVEKLINAGFRVEDSKNDYMRNFRNIYWS